MTLFRFDFNTDIFYKISNRNGDSSRKKWSEVNFDEQIFLKDITFGVCNHPFNPGEISFRRKTFSPYTDKDYGIAIKGTLLSEEEYNDLMIKERKVNPIVNKLFWKWGEKHWQSYPNLVKMYKEQGLWDLIRQNPNLKGTYKHETFRKFPYHTYETNSSYMGDQKIYYQPHPVKALRFCKTNGSMGIIFNEGATVKTWHDLHDTISNNWRGIVSRRANAT